MRDHQYKRPHPLLPLASFLNLCFSTCRLNVDLLPVVSRRRHVAPVVAAAPVVSVLRPQVANLSNDCQLFCAREANTTD